MNNTVNLPKRKPNRLRNYDYSQNGAYFITICTKNQHPILGTIPVWDAALGVLNNPAIPPISPPPHTILSSYGEIVKTFIENTANAYTNVSIPHYVIMPNHVHIILIIENVEDAAVSISPKDLTVVQSCRTPKAVSPTKAVVPQVVNAVKGLSSKRAGFSIWQRSYSSSIKY